MKHIIVDIKGTKIGQGEAILVQTMCNCSTNDIEAAVEQCTQMSKAGAGLIRLTTQGVREVASLAQIKERLHANGIFTPLVADIHFSSEAAIAAAKVADKVRINPGNFAPTHEKAREEFKKFIQICKDNNTAIRIGINHGSLGKRITELFGNTAKGMQEAICEWVDMCIEEKFFNVVLSLKASNTLVMIEAYRLLYQWMKEKDIIFPVHLGVTEAGNGDMGRIKSAVGIGTLLSEGIGDTIRVSLTENPINEIPAGYLIARYNYSNNDIPNDHNFNYTSNTKEEFIISAACEIGPLLINNKIEDFSITGTIAGKNVSEEDITELKDNILQAARKKFNKCEYVACPGCGRTLYDLEATFNEVKKRTSHFKGLVIAVMGCIVNGPGEMADADYGYVGEWGGKVTIYRKKEAIARSIPQEKAIDMLIQIIENDLKK